MSGSMDKRYRSTNNPYNNMESFLPLDKRGKAQNTLKNSENIASQNSPISTSANISEKIVNNKSNSTIKNTIKNNVTGIKNVKKLSTIKKLSPAAFIFTIFMIGAGLLGAGQGLLGAQLTHLFTEATDLQFSSSYLTKLRLTKRDVQNAKLSKSFSDRLEQNGITIKDKKITYKGEEYSFKKFKKALNTDTDLQDAFTKSAYGRASGQFDTSAKKFYANFGSVRKLFADTEHKSEAELKRIFKKTISSRTDNVSGTVNTAKQKTDEDGDLITEKSGDDLTLDQIEGNTPETKARSFVNSIASKADAGSGIACTALQVANLITITAAANQTLKGIEYFLGIMEPISRTMDGEESLQTNNALNTLTQKTISKAEYVEDGKTKTKKYTGSMLEASMLKNILSGAKVDRKETERFSPLVFSSSILAALATNKVTVTACSGIRASSALISLAANGVPGGKLATLSVGLFLKAAKNVVISGTLAVALGAIIPMVAKAFFTPVFDYYVGVAGGNLFSYGGIQNNLKLAQKGSAYMPTSAERLEKQNRKYQVALAQEAKIERHNYSPFDASNPNTFMGTLATTIIPSLSSATNISSFTNSVANILSSSIIKISPTASALGATNSYTSHYFECEDLSGTVCDANGVNIPATDFSTLNTDYNDATYQAIINANTNNGSVKEDSNLARFISFCVNRESPWGVSDANILSALQTDGGIILNNLPVVGDALDFVNAIEDATNQGWATGAYCVNSADNPKWDSEFKYYQRYVEDSRIDATLNGNDNPVIAYENKYEESHPLDNSYSGILARYSGLSKDQVRFALEVVDYSDYLAKYDQKLTTGEYIIFSSIEKFTPKDIFNNSSIENENYIISVLPKTSHPRVQGVTA